LPALEAEVEIGVEIEVEIGVEIEVEIGVEIEALADRPQVAPGMQGCSGGFLVTTYLPAYAALAAA
jgi:hypothetical protein